MLTSLDRSLTLAGSGRRIIALERVLNEAFRAIRLSYLTIRHEVVLLLNHVGRKLRSGQDLANAALLLLHDAGHVINAAAARALNYVVAHFLEQLARLGCEIFEGRVTIDALHL